MTKPRFTDQISLGNIIQMAAMLLAVTGAFLFVKFQSEATALEAKDIAADLVEMAGRVRGIEVREATRAERLEGVKRDIGDIKSALRENSSLLRQLLQQTGSRRQ